MCQHIFFVCITPPFHLYFMIPSKTIFIKDSSYYRVLCIHYYLIALYYLLHEGYFCTRTYLRTYVSLFQILKYFTFINWTYFFVKKAFFHPRLYTRKYIFTLLLNHRDIICANFCRGRPIPFFAYSWKKSVFWRKLKQENVNRQSAPFSNCTKEIREIIAFFRTSFNSNLKGRNILHVRQLKPMAYVRIRGGWSYQPYG